MPDSQDKNIKTAQAIDGHILSEANAAPASAFEAFLNAPLKRDTFAVAAWEAAKEIALQDGLSELNGIGQRIEVDSRADTSGWALHWRCDQMSNGLARAAQNWEETGHATFFRGSKLPDTSTGSFGFSEGGVHLAPRLDTSIGYAGATNQNSYSIGTPLRLPDNQGSLGFVSTWDISLDHNVWRNFQYEGFVAGHAMASTMTVRDTMQEMKRISDLPASAFKNQRQPDGSLNIAQAEQEFEFLFRHQSYETISTPGSAPKELFLSGPSQQLVKINPENPKWDQWMARVQEANLRHFYEIAPLEISVKDLEARMNDGSPASQAAKKAVLQNARAELDKVNNAGWTANTMEEARGLMRQPWVSGSARVGSSKDAVHYPPHVAAVLSDHEDAILDRMKPAAQAPHTPPHSAQTTSASTPVAGPGARGPVSQAGIIPAPKFEPVLPSAPAQNPLVREPVSSPHSIDNVGLVLAKGVEETKGHGPALAALSAALAATAAAYAGKSKADTIRAVAETQPFVNAGDELAIGNTASAIKSAAIDTAAQAGAAMGAIAVPLNPLLGGTIGYEIGKDAAALTFTKEGAQAEAAMEGLPPDFIEDNPSVSSSAKPVSASTIPNPAAILSGLKNTSNPQAPSPAATAEHATHDTAATKTVTRDQMATQPAPINFPSFSF